MGSPEHPEPHYLEAPRQSDTSVEPMRDEDEDFPPVSVRQGRDFRSHRPALNLLSASAGAEYATGETLCSVGYGGPHGVVRREGDTRLASLVAPPFFLASLLLARWSGTEGSKRRLCPRCTRQTRDKSRHSRPSPGRIRWLRRCCGTHLR